MKKHFFALLTTLSLVAPAHAQWATIDVANLVQNIMNVMSNIEQEANSAEQLSNQYRQLELEYAQQRSLPASDVAGLLGTVKPARVSLENYAGAAKGLYGDLDSAKEVAESIYRRTAASGLSQEAWMKREADFNKSAQEGNGFLTDYQANVLNQVGRRYEEVQRLQSKIVATGGTHESMQLMNSQMNVMLSTMNQMLEHNAILAQRATVRDVAETGKQKAAADGMNDWLESRKKSRERTEESLRMLGGVGR